MAKGKDRQPASTGIETVFDRVAAAISQHTASVWSANVPDSTDGPPLDWEVGRGQLILKLYRESQLRMLVSGSLSDIEAGLAELPAHCPTHLQPIALALCAVVRAWTLEGIDTVCPPHVGPVAYRVVPHSELQEWGLRGEEHRSSVLDLGAVARRASQSEQPDWIRPRAAMALLNLEGRSEPERRRVFRKLLRCLAPDDKRELGNRTDVNRKAWHVVVQAYNTRLRTSDDWHSAADDVAARAGAIKKESLARKRQGGKPGA